MEDDGVVAAGVTWPDLFARSWLSTPPSEESRTVPRCALTCIPSAQALEKAGKSCRIRATLFLLPTATSRAVATTPRPVFHYGADEVLRTYVL